MSESESESEFERAISLANLLTLPSSSIKANTIHSVSIAKSFGQLQLLVAYTLYPVKIRWNETWENYINLVVISTFHCLKSSFFLKIFQFGNNLELLVQPGYLIFVKSISTLSISAFCWFFLKLFNFAWRISALNRRPTEAAKLFELCTSLSLPMLPMSVPFNLPTCFPLSCVVWLFFL